MAGIALSAYRTELATLGFEAAQTTAMNSAINQARREVCQAHDWSFLQVEGSTLSCVVGQQSYQLSTLTGTGIATAAGEHRMVRSVRLRYGNQVYDVLPLDDVDWSRLDDENYGSTGQPRYWNVAGNTLSDSNMQPNLRITPAPDATYTLVIDWVVGPADLGSDAATDALIPARYKGLVVTLAAAKMALRQRDPNAYQMFVADWQAQLRAEKRADKRRQNQSSEQVRDSGVWDVYG